jgi:RHS repeat-associated protein
MVTDELAQDPLHNIRASFSSLTYDHNGNIETLTRNNGGGTGMDVLTYDYGSDDRQSNQLVSVTDGGEVNNGFVDGNTSGDDYEYDLNGNLVKDLNKDISSISYNHLNLPILISYGNGNWIKYIYDASGVKLAKIVYDGSSQKRTDYIGNFIYEEGDLDIILTSEGRVAVKRDGGGTITGYVYQYFHKDHLGNVRMTYTADPESLVFNASMETENASIEEQYFDNIFRHTDAGLNKTPGGNEILKLTATNNVGSNIILSVMPGDEIDLDVWCAYQSGSDYNTTYGLATMIELVAGAFGGIEGAGGESGAIYEAIEGGLAALGLGGTQGSYQPAAYINYLVFDKDLNYLFGGYEETVDNNQGVMQQFGIPGIDITEPGYIYVYLSNESSNTSKLILFDEMNVTLTRPILQVNDYYPFGMAMAENGYENVLEPENKFTYNGKEKQDDNELNWQYYGFRYFDNALAKWHIKEPLADYMTGISPYAYAYNNPVTFRDLYGLWPANRLRGSKPWFMQKNNNFAADTDRDSFIRPSEQYLYDSYVGSGEFDEFYNWNQQNSIWNLKGKGDWTNGKLYSGGNGTDNERFRVITTIGGIYHVFIYYGSTIINQYSHPVSTNENKRQKMHIGLSLDVTIASPYGGFTFEAGRIGTREDSREFIASGNAKGVEASIGFNILIIVPSNVPEFKIEDFAGKSINYTAGKGLLSVAFEGDGYNDLNFGNKYYMYMIGVGLGFGGSVSNQNTQIWKPDPRFNITFPTTKF